MCGVCNAKRSLKSQNNIWNFERNAFENNSSTDVQQKEEKKTIRIAH